MTNYIERITKAIYIDPTGREFEFKFEDVSRKSDRRVSYFNYPDVAGTDVFSTGFASDVFPMECIFTGINCDIEADAFYEALSLEGVATLYHPRYGRKRVVAVSREQRDNLKSSYGQSIITVEFYQTLEVEYPNGIVDLGTYLDDSILGVADLAKSNLGQATLGVLDDVNSFIEKIQDFSLSAQESFFDMLSPVKQIEDTFRKVSNFASSNANYFLTNLESLSGSVYQICNLPARVGNTLATTTIRFKQLLQSVREFPLIGEGLASTKIEALANGKLVENFISQGLVTMAITAKYATYTTKREALSAVTALTDELQLAQEHLESLEAQASEFTGGASEEFLFDPALWEAVSLYVSQAQKYLILNSFGAKVEKYYTLPTEYALPDLIYQLHGEYSDELLDFFISSNGLSEDSILLLKRGTRVVYYE